MNIEAMTALHWRVMTNYEVTVHIEKCTDVGLLYPGDKAPQSLAV